MEWLLIAWPTLILLGLGLRMALRLTYGARGPEPGDPLHALLSITAWVLIGLGLGPAVLAGVFTFFGLIVVALAAATLVEAVLQRRAADRRSMCTMLSLLVERGQQLDSAVLLAGYSMRGIVGRAARRLFRSMQQGTPLAAAAVRHPAALPREASAYLAAGRGTTAQLAALKELSRIDRGELAAVWRAVIDRVAYLSVVLLVVAAVLGFVMIKIVPEFGKIFYEFELELPWLTELAIAISQSAGPFLTASVMGAIPLLLLVCALAGICYLGELPVLKPVSDRLFRGRHMADVLRILAIATEHRQPLAEVLQRIAHTYPSTVIRRRLLSAADLVRAGEGWRDALVQTGSITTAEQSLLHTAERVGNLPWALRTIAQRREKRAAYRLAGALQVLYPMAILALGALIGFYVVALFVPLVRLIQGLT